MFQLTLLPLQVMEEMLALLRRSCSCVPSTSPSLVLSPTPPSPQAGEGGRSSSPRVLLRVQGELAPTWMWLHRGGPGGGGGGDVRRKEGQRSQDLAPLSNLGSKGS